ncbi:uncharacterized protein LOC112846469 [Oreochromis niloticus]|uniref:uncharacterized protein LOC112846469 n=1 Tax=Oreochromis niloticus TaxID=8128 RepID=UPI000DF283CC|nr:uncharacterized protein LOC112846469 [Oreochromis niloticus]
MAGKVLSTLLGVMALMSSWSAVETLYVQGNHTQYPHGYSTNFWWQFMNTTAHLNNRTDCYVCAHMPLSAYTSGLWPYSITEDRSWCLLGLATHPGNRVLWSKANYSTPLNITWSKSPLLNVNCSGQTDLLAWPQVSDPLPDIILLNKLNAAQLPLCVMNNGTLSVGELPLHVCGYIYTYCPPENESRCMKCLTSAKCAENLTLRRTECKFNLAYRIPVKAKSQKWTGCARTVPSSKGTRVLADWYFMCGHKAYLSLPEGWGGLCALVKLSDHVFFMDRVEHHPSNRQKREVDIASPNSFGVTVDTGVPREFRIWSGGAKFFQSLIPNIGVAEVRDHVEINRYALLRHINLTKKLGTALAEEQKAIRTMVLQNRLTLDLITASQGGVCKLIGETCCTFIPDGYTTGGDIYEALQNLTALQKYVADHTSGGDASQGWIAWLTSGPWWNMFLKFLTPILTLLTLLCLFTGCILPCVRSMVNKMIANTFTNYILLQQSDMDAKANVCV